MQDYSTCSVYECARPRHTRDLCRLHYRRPTIGHVPDSPEVRFWRFVDRGECWLWTGPLNPNGYAQFSVEGRRVYAHRFAYELLIGPIPDGLQLDHLCRVRHCVNPKHLEPVTCQENLLRGDTLLARNVAKTECPQGHPYDDANTYIGSKGERKCRSCARIREDIRRPPPGQRPPRIPKPSCANGHLFNETNTYVTPEGWRSCRECHRLTELARRRSRRLYLIAMDEMTS